MNMIQDNKKVGDNEFFALDNANMSRSAILPNDQFDKQELEDEHGIERPFTNSDRSINNSIQMANDAESMQTVKEPPDPSIPDLEQCINCGRKFFVGRLQLHQKTCTPDHPFKAKPGETEVQPKPKAQASNGKQINMPKRRKKPKPEPESTGNEVEETTKLPKWKLEHQQLVQSIRYSREVEKAEKTGGNMKEVQERAPKNPLEENYVFCQFCQRKFAPYVAERHIPRCKNIFNRPLPPKTKSFDEHSKKPVKALEKYSQYVGSSINEEQEEVDTDTIQQHSQTAKQQTQSKIFRDPNHSRMSQSQQQSTGGHSVFLPRIQKSPQNYVPIMSRSTPMVQCPQCLRSFDERAAQRHMPVCQKGLSQRNQLLKSKSPPQSEESPTQDKLLLTGDKQFCTNCGAKFANIHKYCGICGRKRLT